MDDWGVWDFVLVDGSAAARTAGGFRAVRAEDSLRCADSVTPEIVTAP